MSKNIGTIYSHIIFPLTTDLERFATLATKLEKNIGKLWFKTPKTGYFQFSFHFTLFVRTLNQCYLWWNQLLSTCIVLDPTRINPIDVGVDTQLGTD